MIYIITLTQILPIIQHDDLMRPLHVSNPTDLFQRFSSLFVRDERPFFSTVLSAQSITR